MTFIQGYMGSDEKKLYAVCDVCKFASRYPRKDTKDVPQGWSGDKDYLLCAYCTADRDDAISEELAAMAYNLR